MQWKQESVCASGGCTGLEITQGDSHQNRVGLLQGPPKDRGKSVIPLLGFGHMAANCQGPDRSMSYWSCGKEGHAAGFYIRKPQCYLCSAKEDKPRDDHIPGTMRCATFWEAAPKKKPSRGRV